MEVGTPEAVAPPVGVGLDGVSIKNNASASYESSGRRLVKAVAPAVVAVPDEPFSIVSKPIVLARRSICTKDLAPIKRRRRISETVPSSLGCGDCMPSAECDSLFPRYDEVKITFP